MFYKILDLLIAFDKQEQSYWIISPAWLIIAEGYDEYLRGHSSFYIIKTEYIYEVKVIIT